MTRQLHQFLAVCTLFFLALGDAGAQGRMLLHEGIIPGHIVVNRVARQFYLYKPKALKPGPAPVLFLLHGGSPRGDALANRRSSGFEPLAEREGFLIVYPNGIRNAWNDGRDNAVVRRENRNANDDVGFIRVLIKRLIREGLVDAARIYVSGISNGGFMSLRLACDLSDLITAIAPVAASLPESAKETCKPSRPMPILLTAGRADKLIKWDGGWVVRKQAGRGRTIAMLETMDFWRRHNGCDEEAEMTRLQDRDKSDETRVIRHRWKNCREGASTQLFEVENGGHLWPAMDTSRFNLLLRRILGNSTKDIDQSDIWNFLKVHKK